MALISVTAAAQTVSRAKTPKNRRILNIVDTCGDDKDHCAPENCNPSVLYGRCWSPAWNTSTNDNSDHRRRDDPNTSDSSNAEAMTVHETVTASQVSHRLLSTVNSILTMRFSLLPMPLSHQHLQR